MADLSRGKLLLVGAPIEEPPDPGTLFTRADGSQITIPAWESEMAEFRTELVEIGAAAVGNVKVSLLSLTAVLSRHPFWRGVIRHNEIRRADICGERVIDRAFVSGVRCWLEKTLGMKTKKEDASDAVRLVASRNTYQPIQAWLRGLPVWDGVGRIGSLLDLLGVPDDLEDGRRLYQEYIKKWMVGAVQRALVPGCQFDVMLILQGAQGIKKSRFWEHLAGPAPFYNIMKSKLWDNTYHIHSAWIHEYAEVEKVTTKADLEELKSHITTATDTIVPKYENQAQSWKRACAFVATANSNDFLRDDDNRRFWILPCATKGQIDTAWVSEFREQLWAEAISLRRDGILPYLDEPWMVLSQKAATRSYVLDDDPWSGKVEEYISRNPGHFFCTADLLDYIEKPIAQRDGKDSHRLAAILKKRGMILKETRLTPTKTGKRWVPRVS